MGLAVTAYSKARVIGQSVNHETVDINDRHIDIDSRGYICLVEASGFGDRMLPFVENDVVRVDGEELDVLNMSYSGYSAWRDELARLAGYPQTSETFMGVERSTYTAGAAFNGEGPFFELINFSDCEGTLGTTACQKLLRDYEQYSESIIYAAGTDERFLETFRCLGEGLRFAADDGLLRFS